MKSLTVASCLQLSSQLATVSDSPRLDVEIILAHVLQKSRTYLFAWPEKVLTEVEQKRFAELLARRVAGEPVAHIIGVREFWSLEFLVNNTTLIPRPDTELLVDAALNKIDAALNRVAADGKNGACRLLDLGTGTGAIVLALAHERPLWQCLGVDKEMAAVELAEKNRKRFNLHNVVLQQSDWFSTLDTEAPFDIIVSNPPYIDPQDAHLKQGDVRFEPLSALIANDFGMADLKFIIAHAPRYLQKNGWLLLEHGYDQASEVRELLAAHGYSLIETLRDMGGNERVTLGQHMGKNAHE